MIEDDQSQRQVDGAQLLEDAQVIDVPQSHAPGCFGNLHPQEPAVAKVQDDIRRNRATLVDQPRVDAIRGIFAQPADEPIGPTPTGLGC